MSVAKIMSFRTFLLGHMYMLFDEYSEGFRSIVNQKNSYGCEQESQDLI
jgi:hypothetical protein